MFHRYYFNIYYKINNYVIISNARVHWEPKRDKRPGKLSQVNLTTDDVKGHSVTFRMTFGHMSNPSAFVDLQTVITAIDQKLS